MFRSYQAILISLLIFTHHLMLSRAVFSQQVDSDNVCYMVNSSGNVIELSQLCGSSKKLTSTPSTHVPRDNFEVLLGPGDSITPDGIVTNSKGLRFRPVFRDGRAVGIQLFKPDGLPLHPGEKLRLTNGEVIQQASMY